MRTKDSLSVLLALLGAASLATTAGARNLVWTGGAGDSLATPEKWNIQNTSSHSDTAPGADDNIVIGINKPLTLDVSNAEDLAVVNGCLGICLAEVASTCNIVVPDGCDKSIDVPIVGAYNVLQGNISRGTVNFSGTGTVRLCATNMLSYATLNFNVDGTDVWLPQNDDLALNAYQMGTLAVSNGATLHMPTCHNGSLNKGANYVLVQKVFGDGTITASERTELRFGGSGGVFSGVLGTQMRLFSGGRQMLTGVSSTMTYAPIVYNAYHNWSKGNGTLGVMKFGKAGDPSSIGTTGQFNANVHGGTYLYLGEGEETDKYFQPYAAADGVNVIDGGAHGGLEFIGNGGVFTATDAAGSANNIVVGLGGSNAAPCVFRGRVSEFNGNYLLSFVKRGTGTWRFADPALDGLAATTYRTFRGCIGVEEGVLQVDTLAPPGEYCSVGLATALRGVEPGNWKNREDEDWAFSLGGTDAATEGTLEYMGAQAGLADRRRVRLESDGRFRANGPKKVKYRMAATTSARAKTLSLDGESVATNEVHGVFDTAEHPVSIVKEGGGTWLVVGDGPLHGGVKVKGGRLIVQNFPAGSPYTWFRLTVKDLFDPVNPSDAKNCFSIRFFGLYDADGRCQTDGTLCAEDMRAAAVEPGEAGYDTTRQFSRGNYWPDNDHNPTNLFRFSPVFDVRPYSPTGAANYYPRLSDESTWVSVVVQLTNGAPEIASYDWANTYGFTGGNKGGFHWTPNVWSLEGSVDGVSWENVKLDGGDFSITTNGCPQLAEGGMFIYSGEHMDGAHFYSRSANNAYWHSGGCAIRGTSTNSYAVLTNVRSVQVDGGATLELDGAAATFTNLVVDVSKGCGAIKGGGAFAAEGTVDVVNCNPGAGVQNLAFDLADTTGAEGISGWSVKVGGVERPHWRVKYADGNLTICPPGTKVTFR